MGGHRIKINCLWKKTSRVKGKGEVGEKKCLIMSFIISTVNK